MMFGSKKNKELVEKISAAVQPNLIRVQTVHGVPTGFWDDAYVLGFLMGQINAYMSIFGGDDLSIADKGRVVIECFAALSGRKGKPISEMSMVFAHDQNPDFLRANQNGMFIAMYDADRIPEADGHPPIIEAKQRLSAANKETSIAEVTGELAKAFWVEEVKARLSIVA